MNPTVLPPGAGATQAPSTMPATLAWSPAASAALQSLLPAVCDETGAGRTWWQVEGPHAALPLAPGAPAGTHVSLCLGRAGRPGAALHLWAAQASRPAGAAVALALEVAEALLEGQLRAEAWRLEAERRGEAGRVASDWLWETDAEGRVVWFSEDVHPVTGLAACQELGQRVVDVYRPRSDEHQASWLHYQQARAEHKPFRHLLVDRELPQGTATVAISGNPRFDAEGRFCGYRGASRDVTADLVARRDVRRSRELLKQTLAGLPARVMISGPDDRVLLSNAAWQEHMGAAPPAGRETWADWVRHHVATGCYPQARGREAEFTAWRLGLVSATPVPQEVRWQEGWVLVIDRLLPDGHVVHLVVDISERKRTEEALAEAEMRWRCALEGAGDGAWDWRADTDHTYFSSRCAQMLGLTREQLGHDWRARYRRVHPEDRSALLAALMAHLEGRTEVFQAVHRIQHVDGHYLWIRDRGKAVQRDENGRALRVVGTHTDITREREAEAAQREREAIELASRSKSEFLSRLSHELRTPLNALLGFVRLMQQQASYREDYLRHMLTAGTHLQQLINDVLDVQQVEQGALMLQRQPVNLAVMVAEVNQMLGPQAEAAGVELGPAPALPGWVTADPQRLRQVLLNLGSNALKYNRAGGGVRWTLQAEPRDGNPGWCLHVQDDGLGMSPFQLARLFQPFERLGREESGIEGTGLGLVIARRFIEAQGGSIEVFSTLGQGTTVRLWLPPALAEAAPVQPASPVLACLAGAPVAGPADRTHRVLLVEDDALCALLFGEALREHPEFELKVATNAAEALQCVAAWQPELLVIDGHLPDATGHELLQRLRTAPGLVTVPAVMATADAMPADRDAALAQGFVDHWPKPLDVRCLPAQLRAMLPR